MAKPWNSVKEGYIQNPISNPQGCDEPYDPAYKERFEDGQIVNGRGSQGGGSKMSSNNTGRGSGSSRPTSVSGRGSSPRNPQKLRG